MTHLTERHKDVSPLIDLDFRHQLNSNQKSVREKYDAEFIKSFKGYTMDSMIDIPDDRKVALCLRKSILTQGKTS